MPAYRIVLKVPGTRLDKVREKAQTLFGSEVQVVSKVDLITSRQARLGAIAASVQDLASDIEELKEELEEWRDNLPESLQGGGKADELEDAISSLEELKDSLEGVDFTTVSFPGMY